MAGALAVAMAEMAARFTRGRKAYADVADEIEAMLPTFESARAALTAAVDADAEAFATLGAAYALPKGDDEEKQRRDAAIQSALSRAAEVPMGVLRTLAEVTPAWARLARIGNRNLVSDTGVAAILSKAAADAATMNVMVNARAMREGGEKWQAEAEALRARIATDAVDAQAAVVNRMDPATA